MAYHPLFHRILEEFSNMDEQAGLDAANLRLDLRSKMRKYEMIIMLLGGFSIGIGIAILIIQWSGVCG